MNKISTNTVSAKRKVCMWYRRSNQSDSKPSLGNQGSLAGEAQAIILVNELWPWSISSCYNKISDAGTFFFTGTYL
jgi:hypothetical protein